MVLENPAERKYRRLKLSNRRFAASVGAAPGAVDFLLGLGFGELDGGADCSHRTPCLRRRP
eukprot:SAG11_NODE_9820_length_878_cov_1.563543_1_plen_61_part_10